MTANEILDHARQERIAHHYFYQPGSTMVRFPLLKFNPEQYPDNAALLQQAIQAEKDAGRYELWDRETPIPFTHLQKLLFPGF